MRVVALLLSVVSVVVALPREAHAQPTVDARLRTVVMGIAGRRGIEDKTLATALSDVVLGAYSAEATRLVIGPGDIQRALEWEASRQEAGCDSNSCLAEVGAALDAARIVSGTLDAVGDVYLLTLVEIDAHSLEPVGRGQRQVAREELALLNATKELAGEVIESVKHVKETVAAVSFAGSNGTIDITSDPRDVIIFVGGKELGRTPTRLDNVNAGRHTLRLVRDNYEATEIEVPVYAGATTKVSAELRLNRAIAEKNLEVKQARWRDHNEWNQIIGWSKTVGGGLVGVVGAGVLLGNNRAENAVEAVPGTDRLNGNLIGGALLAGGIALGAWGVLDLLNPPPLPVPEWEIERKVTVTPPSDRGDQEVHLLQEGRPAATR